ncbi:MaoC family dehydratase [Thermoflavimicrobium dichotomicum]|uniref:Acyl dehydratase n=1 Tax=Thermoflavimicrobium dichotomicum TaxID=46223 RepID=A0A1I3TG42_9BACL|nr:MaoC family dehydratase [Thermoflavimicrobium dichotomicum]SFJ69600.1 Acyl dehydratase [Thermoflavimicrobium dichotomicum]
MAIQVGDVFTWERTFTEEDVLAFAEFSGDRGRHHLEKDEQGRLVVHGLLTASITTKIGGDLNYVARKFEMEFIRPVFTGDTIRCEVEVTEVVPTEKYLRVKMKSVCRNQHGKEVLIGKSDGVIWNKND